MRSVSKGRQGFVRHKKVKRYENSPGKEDKSHDGG